MTTCFHFQITNPVDFISMTKNFGVVYLVQKSVQNDVRLNIVCGYLASVATTSLVIEIEEKQGKEFEWTRDSVDAFLDENSPVLSFVKTQDDDGSEVLRLTNFIRNYSADSFFTFNLMDTNMYTYFELDHNVGTLRTKFSTLDYESFVLNIILCNFESFCDVNRKGKILKINIEIHVASEDESSSLVEIIESKNKKLKSSGLLPGLSIVKFKCENEASIRTSLDYFEIVEFENGIKEIYLTNRIIGDQIPSNLKIELIVLNKIEKIINLEIEQDESSRPLANAQLLASLTLNRVSEGEFIFKFSNEIQLLNYKYLFYLDENNQLCVNHHASDKRNYDLYFQDMDDEARFYLIKLSIQQNSNGLTLPKLFYHSEQDVDLNLKKFSMKLNMSMGLDDLLVTNQTEPLIVLNKNSRLTNLNSDFRIDPSLVIFSIFKIYYERVRIKINFFLGVT